MFKSSPDRESNTGTQLRTLYIKLLITSDGESNVPTNN